MFESPNWGYLRIIKASSTQKIENTQKTKYLICFNFTELGLHDFYEITLINEKDTVKLINTGRRVILESTQENREYKCFETFFVPLLSAENKLNGVVYIKQDEKDRQIVSLPF